MSSRRKSRTPSKTLPPQGAGRPETSLIGSPRLPLSRRRRWLFRLTAAVLAPLLFLAALEVGLRLARYGEPTAFYLGPDADGNYTTNLRFGWRFFPPAIARNPIPACLAPKPAGTVRVFVLGSSAALGMPSPAFSFGRILEAMLRDRYPGLQFEVVNAAMTAVNSHVVLEIARDCAARQPDLYVVYMGNNEVVGPYGPGTVFEQWSPSRSLIRANIWLKSTRTGQLIGNAIQHVRGSSDLSAWRGMEMFMANQVAADDPRLKAVYDNFHQNLTDLCAAARRSGAPVILSTVAVNLKDFPPFASKHRPDLSADDLAKWDAVYQAGVELESKSQWREALAKYEAAAQIDGQFADLAFRKARCLAASGRLEGARKCYAAARDLDVLRFRADSQINAAIRQMAAEQEPFGVRLADAERALAESDLSPGGIPGEELFYEHVHLTFDGNYLLARSVLEQVEAALPQLTAARKTGEVLTRKQCAEALTFTLWDEAQLTEQMTEELSRPPFTNQLDHAAELAKKRDRLDRLMSQAMAPQAMREARRSYEEALKKSPDDWQLYFRHGNLALATGNSELAAEQLRAALQRYPLETMIYINLGDAERQNGRIDEAIANYKKAIEIEPGSAKAHYSLGSTFLASRRYEEAVRHFQQSLAVDAGSVMGHYYLAAALGRCKRIDDAIAEYQKAVEIDPQFIMAHYNLGVLLAARGRKDDAAAHAKKALETETGNAAVHVNLGMALADNGDTDQAITQYEKALAIDPQCITAHINLGVALAAQGQKADAIAEYRKALEIEPHYAAARCKLGSALADRGEFDEAMAQFQEVLKFDPRSDVAYCEMGKTFAAQGRLDDAIASFRKALQLDPNFADARRELDAALAERDNRAAKPMQSKP
jgi:tetratricopeptide (TPR) repeat protein